jgi:hypothetical protein
VANVTINGEMRPGRSGRKNWGELLDSLEQADDIQRRMVTAVRFDGVDVPTFRDQAVLTRDLSSISAIDVEMSSLHELLHDSARAAYESVAPLQRALTRIAKLVRVDDPSVRGSDLSEFMAALRTLTALTAMLATASGGRRHTEFEALIAELCGSIGRAIERQGQGDWQGLADVLDGELATALDRWSVILVAVQDDFIAGASQAENESDPASKSAAGSSSADAWTA